MFGINYALSYSFPVYMSASPPRLLEGQESYPNILLTISVQSMIDSESVKQNCFIIF